MRISSNTIYELGIASMQQQTSALLHTQQQLASGRRMLSPADDPVAAARALDLSQSLAMERQYGANADLAADSLALEESTLASIGGVLQDLRSLALTAGNAVLNASDRASLALEIQGRYEELLGLANSRDGSGRYLFAGFQGSTRPFSETAPGAVTYNGDQGQRLIQVSASRQIAVGDSGAALFQRIPTGNGSFVAQAGAGNSGAAVIDAGTVLDPLKWNAAGNSMDFSLKFAVSGGATSYDIIDNASGLSLLTGLAPGAAPYPRAYLPGSAIALAQTGPPAFDYGAQIDLSGAPADGDSFSLKASTSQDMFKTVSDLATLLRTSSAGAALTNGLSGALSNLDNALANVLDARTGAGTRLRELDSAKMASEDRGLLHSQSLSRLQDLDYAKAAAELRQKQTNLEAAQKSFAMVSGLSLFDYL